MCIDTPNAIDRTKIEIMGARTHTTCSDNPRLELLCQVIYLLQVLSLRKRTVSVAFNVVYGSVYGSFWGERESERVTEEERHREGYCRQLKLYMYIQNKFRRTTENQINITSNITSLKECKRNGKRFECILWNCILSHTQTNLGSKHHWGGNRIEPDNLAQAFRRTV